MGCRATCSLFFFLMVRRPPRSTLFPYTTPLPISVDVDDAAVQRMVEESVEHAFEDIAARRWVEARLKAGRLVAARSEEHTSELQSRGHLVCRLLLEKKKTTHKHLAADMIHLNNKV